MRLSEHEQSAVLQCIWQVMAANPTPFENDYIQNSLLKGWQCIANVDMSMATLMSIQLGCEVKPWVMVAIQQDPYESFDILKELNPEKKIFVKSTILNLIEHAERYSQRAPYAHTLFENCEIPFSVKPRIFADGHIENRIV